MSMLIQNHLHGNSHASRRHFSFVSSFEVQKSLVKGVVGHIEDIADSSKMQECRQVPLPRPRTVRGHLAIALLPIFYDTFEISTVTNSLQGFVVGD